MYGFNRTMQYVNTRLPIEHREREWSLKAYCVSHNGRGYRSLRSGDAILRMQNSLQSACTGYIVNELVLMRMLIAICIVDLFSKVNIQNLFFCP